MRSFGRVRCSTRYEKCEEGLLMLREARAGFANHKRIKKMLVGAVGIENNNGWDPNDLRGTRRSTKSLKGNDRERIGSLIDSLELPRFFRILKIPDSGFSNTPQITSRLRAQILRRGWQADKKSPNRMRPRS